MKNFIYLNGCKTDHNQENKPQIFSKNKSLNLKQDYEIIEINNNFENEKHLFSNNSSVANIIIYNELPKKEHSLKSTLNQSFKKKEDLANYFKTSFHKNEKKNDNIALGSNGGATQIITHTNEVGKYAMKLNFFDESDGFLKNNQFID